MKNIHDLTNMLRDVRKNYQLAWNAATKTKKTELEKLKRTMIAGTPEFAAREREIEFDFDLSIVAARTKAAEKATTGIEDLREWELAKVNRIDTDAMQKINALKEVPLTKVELTQLLNKYGTSNYWAQKFIGLLAEENGVSVTELPLDSPVDVKLSVLDGLSDQLAKLLEHYDSHKATPEAGYARFLYLNDDVLENSVNIYNNGVRAVSEMDAATRACLKIRAMSGQMSKACAIANSLRNLKKEDARNALLYQLAKDDTIMSEAYQIAGIADEMAEWKHGKAERYITARKMTDNLKTVQDTERIKESLRSYVQRVSEGKEAENEFLRHELMKSHKKNSFIGQALAELDWTEKKMLLDSGTQEEMYQQQNTGGKQQNEF